MVYNLFSLTTWSRAYTASLLEFISIHNFWHILHGTQIIRTAMEDPFVGRLQPIAVVLRHLYGTRRYVRLLERLEVAFRIQVVLHRSTTLLRHPTPSHLILSMTRLFFGAQPTANKAGPCIAAFLNS
jgi:hypothetical protein